MVPQDNRLRFKPEIGPPVQRRRGTAKSKAWTATYHLTSAEFETFENFFEDDLKDGTLPFDMPHPRTCTTTRFTFDESAYSTEEFGAGKVSITVNLLEMP